MNFSIYGKDYGLSKHLEKVAKAAFSVLGAGKKGEIELAFISKKRISELNRNYRNIDSATDVLSFIVNDEPLVGQIFICYTKAAEQAKENGIMLEEEINKLVAHGITHLYGFDHKKEDDFLKMEETEKLIMEKL